MTAKSTGYQKPSKYGAVKTTVDGIVFASQKEAKRYSELKLLQKAGYIARLQLQRAFPLFAINSDIHGVPDWDAPSALEVGRYVADFCYDELSQDATRFVIEDVKGFRTALYRWKKKHVKAQYGIAITEI